MQGRGAFFMIRRKQKIIQCPRKTYLKRSREVRQVVLKQYPSSIVKGLTDTVATINIQ